MSSDRSRAPVAGLAFALAYFIAFQFGEGPAGGDSSADVVALYADPGSRTRMMVMGVGFGAAGLALLPFLSALRERLPRGRATDLATAGGLLYVALLLVTSGLATAYPLGVTVGELPQPVNPDVARVLVTTSYVILLLPGLWCAAILIAGASLAARRDRILGRGVTTAGLAAVPLLLAGVAWMPQILVPLWILAASISLMRTPAPARRAAAAAA